jgi:hypothetical protein
MLSVQLTLPLDKGARCYNLVLTSDKITSSYWWGDCVTGLCRDGKLAWAADVGIVVAILTIWLAFM